MKGKSWPGKDLLMGIISGEGQISHIIQFRVLDHSHDEVSAEEALVC